MKYNYHLRKQKQTGSNTHDCRNILNLFCIAQPQNKPANIRKRNQHSRHVCLWVQQGRAKERSQQLDAKLLCVLGNFSWRWFSKTVDVSFGVWYHNKVSLLIESSDTLFIKGKCLHCCASSQCEDALEKSWRWVPPCVTKNDQMGYLAWMVSSIIHIFVNCFRFIPTLSETSFVLTVRK